MATSAAEKEALRKIKVSGVESVTVAPDGALSTRYRSLDDLERIEDGIASEDSATSGTARIKSLRFGIRSGVE